MYLETEGNRIVYIGTERPEGYTGETYDGRNKVALPGFYNIHCHIPDTLLRGYGEGLPLHRWLTEKMFPFEAKLTEEDVYWSSMPGACELIRSGAASFNDMFYKLEWIERAVRDSGLKANLSFGVSALPGLGSYREYAAYAETEALRRRLAEAGDDRVRADVGLHAEYTSHEGLMRDVADYAREAGLRVHLHLSETRKEHEECKTRHNGLTPAALFERGGLFDVPAIAAHCVWTTEEDWALMEQFCQLAGGREDTWYATNIEIVDYMADAARLQYTAAGDKVYNPNAQSIWVEVDGRHYEIPAGKTVALV